VAEKEVVMDEAKGEVRVEDTEEDVTEEPEEEVDTS